MADTDPTTPTGNPDVRVLEAEVVRLKRENEILKKATAYFARDTL